MFGLLRPSDEAPKAIMNETKNKESFKHSGHNKN